ncbi:hypothetical protein EV714DRAFT_242944 [Schizophyllum commune]
MSKSSTGTASQNSKLPGTSAWSKGPPTSSQSSRSQSPAPSQFQPSHSRRASAALGQGVPIKDGVSIPRTNVGAAKQSSSPVTFGSIDDAAASAPISSSPATAPTSAVKDVKTFGSVDAMPSTGAPRPGHVNGKGSISQKPAAASTSSSTSTPPPSEHPKPKIDVKAFFRSGGGGAPSASPAASPAVRPTNLPQSQSSQPQSSQPSQQQFPTFVPSSASSRGAAPRSPGFRGSHLNGNGPRPPAGGQPPPAGQPQMNPMASPRMPPAQSLPGGPAPGMQPGMQPGMPPAPMQGWFYPPPYGGYVDPNWAAAYGQWYMPQQGPPPMSPQQHPAQPPPMPMSPRNAPPPLQGGPGTPAPVHASPVPHPPPSHAPSNSINGVASPPGTPASATVPVPGGRLNQSAAPFTPSSSARKITLRAPDGSELKFDKFKQNGQQPAASPATPTVTSPRKPVKIEKPTEAHEKRIAAEKAEAEAKAKKEREQKEKEEKERKEKEEKERKAKEEAERKKAEEEKARKEEEEKARKEAEEKAKREEEEKRLRRARLRSPPPTLSLQRTRSPLLSTPLFRPLSQRLALSTTSAPCTTLRASRARSYSASMCHRKLLTVTYRYDRDFLLQFMEVCKEKPDRMPPLDAIGLEPMGPADFAMSRGGSHRKPSNAQAPSRTSSMNFGGPGGAFGGKPGGSAFGGMGNFQTPTSKLTSQERFERANAGGSPTMGFSRPSALSRTSSQGGPGSTDNKRTRSQRGNKRGDRQEGGKFNGPPQGHGSGFGQNAQNALNLEPVAPLTRSENRWTPGALAKGAEPDSPEVVDRKVKGLLNKLTMEKFDSLSDQIIAWANKSEKEKDGRTLIQVIRLVFEKATDEAAWSEMYARLCRKMMEQISPKVQDDGIRNAEGKPITGGQLFRKYLLNRCQEDFERGWVNKEATAAAAATKAVEDEAVKSANEKKEGGDNEPDLYSDEYYAAQKAKRQGLGLIRFIGELFKLQMLTERIMHQCVQKLLGNVDNPEEEEIESLCKLLTTVGELLDTPRAHAHMDVYFARMKELTKKPTVSSRMQFMLQDLIELRSRNWRARTQAAGPTTIAQIHEIAAKEKAAQEKDAMHRQSTMSRGGSRRGGDRRDSEHVGPDGWTVAGSSAPRPPAKAGDLSKFGNISKATPMTFGPGSVFAGKNANKRDSISRQASTSNMFHALQSEGAEPVTAPKSSRPPSRKPSVDLSAAAGGEAPPQRRKLVLQPRTKPLEENKPDASESEDEGSTAAAAAPSDMSEEVAKKKVEEDVKEFFAIRNMEEAENYFTTLPANHHHLLIDKLVTQAMDRKEADVKLVGDLFTHALGKKLVSTEALEEGIAPTMEFIEDIAIDVPKAWDFMATLVKAACFDEETRTRLANKSSNADKMLSLLS